MIKRIIQDRIESVFFKGKAVIIYGARQVGKTTLIDAIQKKFPDESLYINCDEPDYRDRLTSPNSTDLKFLIGRKKNIFIDEAQRIKNIGLTLKLLVDNFPGTQVVATGSSSLDLSNEMVEPLTGRKYEFHLFPLCLAELTGKYSPVEIHRLLEKKMIFGMYPEIEEKPDEAETLLRSLASSYLYRDVLQYQDVRKPELLEKLLVALALQIGNEVSFNELAGLLGVSKQTVSHYVQLLEKAFVIFRLQPFSRNLRSEMNKMRKVYFYDTGIRNALINNLNPLALRPDTGSLWENFIISERIKQNINRGRFVNAFFWRTHQQQEIDYVEESGGALSAFELKWKRDAKRIPRLFTETYPGSRVDMVTKENYTEFIEL